MAGEQPSGRLEATGGRTIAGGSGPTRAPEGLTGEGAAQHYAAIIELSDDAILSKDLNGIILTWNCGAELLFGYSAQEAVGRPVTILIPEDLHNEEPMILERVRRGESVDHYETIRRRKDGSLVDISLTVSPIKNEKGEVVAASKIARDISESKRARARQELLLREMDHRIKNLFALAISVLSLSARSAGSVSQLIEFRERSSVSPCAGAFTDFVAHSRRPSACREAGHAAFSHRGDYRALPRPRWSRAPTFDRGLRYGDFGVIDLQPCAAAERVRHKFCKVWRAFRDCRPSPNSLRG